MERDHFVQAAARVLGLSSEAVRESLKRLPKQPLVENGVRVRYLLRRHFVRLEKFDRNNFLPFSTPIPLQCLQSASNRSIVELLKL